MEEEQVSVDKGGGVGGEKGSVGKLGAEVVWLW